MERVIFLDRDGVINEKAAEGDYIKSWDEFRFLDNVPEAIRCLNEEGYKVVVTSNQRGVARGLMSAEAVETIHKNMQEALKGAGAFLDAVYYCPHEEGQCDCRKPGTGLLRRAEELWEIDMGASFIIGDSLTDMLAGERFGVGRIYIGLNQNVRAEYICTSLSEACNWIIKNGG